MSELGNFALIISFLACVYAIFAGLWSALKDNYNLFLSARAATLICGIGTAFALICLGYSFINNDYSNQYVWQFSNRSMESVYKISAIWGGMDGSMLLWATILAFFCAFAAQRSIGYGRLLAPWTIVSLNSTTIFFLGITLFWTNPFRFIAADFIPPDGNGLNPLLQNPLMAVHPPTLYCGFTLHAIPAALGLAAMLSGNMSNDWIRIARPWSLLAWAFLTVGIVLGGHWAYVELGWGGFWAWDPVENASFLPWLISTAFLHSLMVQERRGMLKLWNIWLVMSAYGLTVYGTFLTRSGIVQSVHAFASTDIGWKFLVYLGSFLALTLILSIKRWNDFKPERSMLSFWSRESLILFNNLIFVALCFGIFWGVMFPVFSEAITGTKQAVGIPFFNAITIPLFLVMLFLMGTGPLIAWGREDPRKSLRNFKWPLILASVSVVILLLAGAESGKAVIAYGLIVFIFVGILSEFHKAYRIQKANSAQSGMVAFGSIFKRHPSRFGGHLVHLGVALAVFGITASMAHKIEKDFVLELGASTQVGKYRLELNKVYQEREKNFESIHALISVFNAKSNTRVGEMHPELRSYFRNSETTTEVALRTTVTDDLYIVLAGVEEGGQKASFKVFVNPFQVWLWIGALVMLAGSLVVIIPVLKYVFVFSSASSHDYRKLLR
jgi:cytochrome c-type biogenesis protein CcmF